MLLETTNSEAVSGGGKTLFTTVRFDRREHIFSEYLILTAEKVTVRTSVFTWS